ncbi:hypothetical protein QFZ79_001457 [Arthrobacter sp. V4I6]|uniref:hypothetical protein n=1 Tax=unclassified Arthrobacter TaxID=235627 RepID=UPI0027897B80|nr:MULTISPECIES: hypothetical protein [unclassified Arthrobacter]MDQ0819163.1 hypothetical protein [Arthrobacter sp. V1I7]MDQ0853346.1 hypothetical protein [Arthrobacter sp. V4I6]
MGNKISGIPAARTRPRRLSSLVRYIIVRARMVTVPYGIGEVVVGDDHFNGRREGHVVVKNGTFVGLQTADRIFFYDYRQLRRPD